MNAFIPGLQCSCPFVTKAMLGVLDYLASVWAGFYTPVQLLPTGHGCTIWVYVLSLQHVPLKTSTSEQNGISFPVFTVSKIVVMPTKIKLNLHIHIYICKLIVNFYTKYANS